jgi:hypothetical protein
MKQLFLISFSLFSTFILSQTVPSPLLVTFNVFQVENSLIDMTILEDSAMLNDPAMQDEPAFIKYKTEELIHQGEINGNIVIHLLLVDTLGVKNIHYKIGRAIGSNDIIEGVAGYDYRLVNQVKLNIGLGKNISNLYGEFYIENDLGETSTMLTQELYM